MSATCKVGRLTLLDDRELAIRVVQKQARDTTSLEVWIPRSQISYMRKLGRDSKGMMEIVIEIPEWLATEKNLDSE